MSTPTHKGVKIGTATVSFQEVCDLFDAAPQENPSDHTILTNDEINRARRNKQEATKKVKTFRNTPLYRALHNYVRLEMECMVLMPRKFVKVNDIILQDLSDMIRWCAAAYNHQDPIIKIHSLEEAYALMTTIRIFTNCRGNSDHIGKHKTEQLAKSIDSVERQIVAWRGSILQSQG